MQPKTSKRDSTAFQLLGYCLPGSFQVLHFLSDLSSILQLYTMDKLQKILLAAAPIIAQPPPLPPVLQVATQAGIIQYLQDAGGSINQPRHSTDYIKSSCNDSDMEESPVKENVCRKTVNCGSGHTCITFQNRCNENLVVSAGNLKRLQICSIIWIFFLMCDQIWHANTTPQNCAHSPSFDLFSQFSWSTVARRIVVAHKRWHSMKRFAPKSSLICLSLVSCYF